MKNLVFTVIASLGLCHGAYSQVTLHTGESWSYQFNSLPFFGNSGNSGSYGRFSVITSGLGAGEQLQIQMFENNFSDAPVTWGQNAFSAQSMWQDLQGAVRVTSISGTFNIDSVTLEADLGAAMGGWEVYKTTFAPTSVPEPSSLALAFLACVGLFGWCKPSNKCHTGQS